MIRLAAWILLALIIVLSLVPPNFRPETEAPHDFEHFAIFAVTGCAFGLGYSRRSKLLLLGLLGFCAVIEIAQIAIPGRHARLEDFIVDAVAVCVSAAVAAIVGRRVWDQGFGDATS